jgi:NAD-dependent SIR2 family protein deacetylase
MTLATNQSDLLKTVFFLGAGASVSAGVPTFSDFRNQANIIKKDISSENESGVNNLFENVLEYWNKNFDDYNIEELYEAVEMQEMLKKTETITTKDIEEFIFHTIIKSSIRTKTIGELYNRFLEYTLDSNPSTIITTNWDTLLESTPQWPSVKGYINYESVEPYDPSLDNRIIKNSTQPFCILKLHGSLNWGYCNNCGKIYYLTQKVSEKLISEDGVYCNNNNCRKKNLKLQQIIVPPKLSKLIKPEQNLESVSSTSPYFKLVRIWMKAYDNIKSCERIFFIGYSFPETDVQMRIFISNALRVNSNLKEVIIVSSQKHGNSRVNFEERYLSILPRGINYDLKFHYNGFEGFLDSD